MSDLPRGSRHSPKGGSHCEISSAPQAHDQHSQPWETLGQARRGLDSIFRLKVNGTSARGAESPAPKEEVQITALQKRKGKNLCVLLSSRIFMCTMWLSRPLCNQSP